MEELVQFLRDRLDDDAAFMEAAIRLRESGAVTASPAATEGAFALMDVVANDPDTAEALTVFTRTGVRAPGEAERVLAEVEAKRLILDRFADLSGENWRPSPPRVIRLQELRDAVRCLALPYADHPDYSEAWRP
ncbi:DUF6221 family protein [Streptomyces sp. NPDC056112]|uniref:DUF6221 family protein n=1 Tax=Streptomyces sp. NPDC056112 TaxID=3345715 RepID=UPI0035D9DEA8